MNPLPGDVFARRLRQERERLSLSQAELARRMAAFLGQNVESTAITRIEQQTRAVRLDEAVAAAESLGVPLVTLLSEDFARQNEAQIQSLLAERALAEQAWEKDRTEVERLTRAIQLLSAEEESLQDYAAEADPDAAKNYRLDPAFEEAIDSRVPAEQLRPVRSGTDEGDGVTAPTS